MSKIVLSLFFLICAKMLLAQTAQFEFKLYAQDAAGNRDSIIIGYDSRARQQYVDTALGEIEITRPFNTPFEIRAVTYESASIKRTSKKAVAKYSGNCSPYGFSEYITLVYKVRNLPVTLSWDSSLFRPTNRSFPQRCHGLSLLLASLRYYSDCTPPNYRPTPFWQTNTFVEYFDPARNANICYDVVTIDSRSTGGVIDTLKSNNIFFFTSQLIPTEEIENELKINISPNPCFDELNLQLETFIAAPQVQIFNLLGALIKSENYSDSRDQLNLDVSNLQNGIYIAVIRSKDGKIWRTKFVKQ